MTILMPTAPAPAAPVAGRATASSGTGNDFAAVLAAAAGETPAAPASDRDAAGPSDGDTAPPVLDGDRTVAVASTPSDPVVDAGPVAGALTGTVAEEVVAADAAPTIAAGQGASAPTGGTAPAAGETVPAEPELVPAPSSADDAAGTRAGLAQPVAAAASSADAATGVAQPSPAAATASSAPTAAAPTEAAPAAAPSTAAGVTSGAPAAEPPAAAAGTPPAGAAEEAAPSPAATGASAGVTAAAAAGASEPAGLPDATVPAGDRPAQAGQATTVEAVVRPDIPSVRAELGRAEQAAPAASSPPTPQPMSSQLTSALARLRTAPEGTHVLHVRVDPDDLGPVRVTAHIGADGVRVELFGVTDAARDALRGALSELRRDLAATGLRADLDLAADDGSHERPETSTGGERRAESRPPAPTPTQPTPAAPVHPGGLDLLA